MLRQHSEEELEIGYAPAYDLWRFLVRYVSPAAVFLVFLNVVGVLGA